MKTLLILFLLLLFISRIVAQSDSCSVSDSSSSGHPKKWLSSRYMRESIVPAGLALGSCAIMAIPHAKENLQVRLNWNNQESPDYVDLGDDYVRYAPYVALYTLSACGLKPKHDFISRSLVLAVAYISSDFVVFTTKRLSKEARPDNRAHNSMPSQHTAIAFIGATLLDHELGHISPWIPVGGYLTASYVAYLRVARNAHWVNDVLMGAAVGMIMTHATYWAYDGALKLFPKRLTLAPVIDAQQTGLSLSYAF